jgi:hypothetical protein
MRSHLSNYYGYVQPPSSSKVLHDDVNDDDVSCQLTSSFIDKEANGQLQPVQKITNHLKILVSKHDSDDEFQDILNEWRLVAHIVDRALFWLFLVAAASSSLFILVIRPMMKPSLL